jgi:hypothetical protein
MRHYAFDTLKFSRKLESSGMPRDHAISIAEAFADAQETSLEDLATKEGVERIELVVQKDMSAFRSEIRGEFEAFRSEIRGEFEAFRKDIQGQIDTFRLEIGNEIASLKAEFRAEMRALELRMTIKLGAFLMVGLSLMSGVVIFAIRTMLKFPV